MTYWQVYLKGEWDEVASPCFFTEIEAMRWISVYWSGTYDHATITRYTRP